MAISRYNSMLRRMRTLSQSHSVQKSALKSVRKYLQLPERAQIPKVGLAKICSAVSVAKFKNRLLQILIEASGNSVI